MQNILALIAKGALVGMGAILPGISGGVLCVVLGIYKPLMAFFADPFRNFLTHVKKLWPIAVGGVLGFVVFARVVEWLFAASPEPAVWLFIGLICGSLPQLFAEAGQQGHTKGAYLALGFGFTGMLGFLWLLSAGGVQLAPGFFTWLLCGVLWGVGMIVPGLSPSALFIFFDIYGPMAAAMARFELTTLLPMGLGLVGCVLVLSRLIKWLLERHYSGFFHTIFGIVLASTVAIVPGLPTLLHIGCFAVGALAAFFGGRLGKERHA